jgi:hypothetical protein
MILKIGKNIECIKNKVIKGKGYDKFSEGKKYKIISLSYYFEEPVLRLKTDNNSIYIYDIHRFISGTNEHFNVKEKTLLTEKYWRKSYKTIIRK